MLVGGTFSSIGGQADAWGIARWDGSEFHTVGPKLFSVAKDDFQMGAWVFGIVPYEDGLFVAGLIQRAGEEDVKHVLWFDGEQYHSIGTGVSDVAESAFVHDHSLFLGGPFQEAGGLASTNIAIWRFGH